MKYIVTLLLIASCFSINAQNTPKEMKLILVTWDGCRWQEAFRGVDKKLQSRLDTASKFDKNLLANLKKGNNEEKRKALMPFMWGTVAQKGIIIGNKDEGNKLSVHNPFFFSYPGYSELFCGYADRKVNSNDYPNNPNTNFMDFLGQDVRYKNAMVALGNWDAFPKILNCSRNGIPVYHQYYASADTNLLPPKICYPGITCASPGGSLYAEKDTAVYYFAKEYIKKNHPKVAFIGFDETDHFGHEGNYPAYVMAANQSDRWMEDLWNTIQSDPFYKDQTLLIITCDHGRGGAGMNLWRHHGQLVPASKYTWLAVIGPGVKAQGALKTKKHYHHDQIASTLMQLMGKEYKAPDHKVGKVIEEVVEK